MADDLNALLAANRSSTVLQGIANPPVVNPLAAIQAGNQAAQAEFQTRDWQAKQAAGQAYQGAINPQTGEFDANKFRTLLSQSGPAALQAGAALLNTQNISSDELNQQKLKLEQYNSSLGSLMAMGNNVTHADVVAKIQGLMAHNLMTLPEAQRIMSTIPAGQADLAGWVKQHALTVADASTRFNQTIGTRQTFSTPTGDYNAPVPPPGVGTGTVFVPKGTEPGAVQEGGSWVNAQGQPVPQGSPGAVWQPSVTPKVGNPAFPQSGPPQIIQGPGGPNPIVNVPGRGNQIAPTFNPPAEQPQAPGQPPVPYVLTTPPPMPPGARPGGPGPAGSPAVSGPAASSPQAGAEAAAAKIMPPAPSRAIPTAPPQGQQKTLEDNQAAYRGDLAAIPDVMQRARNTAKAYEALGLLKDLNSTTGVGASTINAVRSRLTTLGLSNAQSMKVQQLQEEFGKYTKSLMLDAAGGGSTNLGKEIAEQANPGDHLSMAANFDVLRKNMGETLQKLAAAKSHEDKAGGGYLSHRGDVATETDSRGFAWDMYDATEQAKIYADAKRDGQAAVDKLNAARGMSHSLQLRIPGATRPPPPDKRSMLMPPPTPQVNPLAMVG